MSEWKQLAHACAFVVFAAIVITLSTWMMEGRYDLVVAAMFGMVLVYHLASAALERMKR